MADFFDYTGSTMPTPAPRGFAVGGSPAAMPASSSPRPVATGIDTSAISGAVVQGLREAEIRIAIGSREFKAAIVDVNRQLERR